MSETDAVFFVRWGRVRSPSTSGLLEELMLHPVFNTLRTGDADLRFYITTVQDG